jgi:hypothetical protein
LTSSKPNPTDTARLVSPADEEAVKDIFSATVLDLWKVVNNLTRLRPSKPERYRVAIFGSARATPGTYVYDEVKRAAAVFAAIGCDIVTGGGPGLMQAANEGEGSQRARVARHPRRAAVRAGCESVRRAGVRARNVLHSAPPELPVLVPPVQQHAPPD